MSEAKFTKGTWKAKYVSACISDNENYILVTGDKGEKVFDIEDICVNENDLALILAAPDMYEALEFQCKNCLGRYSISKDSNECALYIRGECMIAKALRKARGETE